MLSALMGGTVMALSVWAMAHWRADLAVALRGFLPICFFLGGLVAVITGLSAVRRRPGPPEGEK